MHRDRRALALYGQENANLPPATSANRSTPLIEHHPVVRHEPVVRTLTVSATRALSPWFRRITVSGDELAGFASVGPADHVKLIFGDGDSAARRDYTPRNFRPANGAAHPELDIDVFLHGDGIASEWAASAKNGDTVTVGGPRGSRPIPSGVRRVILGADESALPALSRWPTQRACADRG